LKEFGEGDLGGGVEGTYRQMLLLVDLFLGLAAGMEKRGNARGLSMFSKSELVHIKEQRHESLVVYRVVFTVPGLTIHNNPSRTTKTKSIVTTGCCLNKA
jgi:hypothetical protein